MQGGGLLGIRHKGGGLGVRAKAGGCRSLVSCFPQLLLSPVTPVDATVVHDDHHNGQLIPVRGAKGTSASCKFTGVQVLGAEHMFEPDIAGMQKRLLGSAARHATRQPSQSLTCQWSNSDGRCCNTSSALDLLGLFHSHSDLFCTRNMQESYNLVPRYAEWSFLMHSQDSTHA